MGLGIPIISDLIRGAKDLISEAIPDADQKRQVNLELDRLADNADQRLHEQLMGQIAVNQTEAQHRSLFVAGWRPFIGWVGGVGVGWTFVASPLVEWLSRLGGWTGTMPELDTAQLMTLVLSLLGVGAMRSYDKAKGTSNDVLTVPPPVRPTTPPPALKQAVRELPEEAPWA